MTFNSKKSKPYKMPAHIVQARMREGKKNFQKVRQYLIGEELDEIKKVNDYGA